MDSEQPLSALLLDPHGDDAVLFACYSLLREKPRVIVTHRSVPSEEALAALGELGLAWYAEWEPMDAAEFAVAVSELQLEFNPSVVYAPAVEDDGHMDHNVVGWAALGVFGTRLRSYLTYAPRGQRSRNGTEVVPAASEIARKLRALACFESQIEQPSTRPWFYDLLDMREWVMP